MSVNSPGSVVSGKGGDLNVSLAVSPKAQGDQKDVARKRSCSEKGLEYFLDASKKNCDKSHRKISKLIEDIEELLKVERLEEAGKKVGTLVEVHKEFEHFHLRYQELLHQQPNDPKEESTLGKEISDLVAQSINKFESKVNDPAMQIAKDFQNMKLDDPPDASHMPPGVTPQEDQNTRRLETRQTLYDKIKVFIQATETHINSNDLNLAGNAMGEIENLFSEFMSFAPQCYPDQATTSDIDKEREFTSRPSCLRHKEEIS